VALRPGLHHAGFVGFTFDGELRRESGLLCGLGYSRNFTCPRTSICSRRPKPTMGWKRVPLQNGGLAWGGSVFVVALEAAGFTGWSLPGTRTKCLIAKGPDGRAEKAEF